MVNHILEIVTMDDPAMASDIGCAFKKTIEASKRVGPVAWRRNLQVVVNAFHGWAHNRLCQLLHHLLYRRGVGIEDLEGMERLFSASNAVARSIRLASQYHWMQALDVRFRQWDQEKYYNLSMFLLLLFLSVSYTILGTFLFNNYKQALHIIKANRPEVDKMITRLNITEDDIVDWLGKERAWLEELRTEPDERVLETSYVRALITLRELE